jgi:hypothetical protein
MVLWPTVVIMKHNYNSDVIFRNHQACRIKEMASMHIGKCVREIARRSSCYTTYIETVEIPSKLTEK